MADPGPHEFMIGQVVLYTGQAVPMVQLDMQCAYSWTTNALVAAVAGKRPAKSDAEATTAWETRNDMVANFLQRIYAESGNLGVLPEHRALNAAATNAMLTSLVFGEALQQNLQLDSYDVRRSPVNPPGTDRYDVIFTFFNPARQLEEARMVYRFTVDVADPLPSIVGAPRRWAVR